MYDSEMYEFKYMSLLEFLEFKKNYFDIFMLFFKFKTNFFSFINFETFVCNFFLTYVLTYFFKHFCSAVYVNYIHSL